MRNLIVYLAHSLRLLVKDHCAEPSARSLDGNLPKLLSPVDPALAAAPIVFFDTSSLDPNKTALMEAFYVIDAHITSWMSDDLVQRAAFTFDHLTIASSLGLDPFLLLPVLLERLKTFPPVTVAPFRARNLFSSLSASLFYDLILPKHHLPG